MEEQSFQPLNKVIVIGLGVGTLNYHLMVAVNYL